MKYRIGYLDEEDQWRLVARSKLKSEFDIVLLDLPRDITSIWAIIIDQKIDAMIIDFRLFENGEVTYDGNDVIQEIHNHNRHFPMFIMTSYDNDAFQSCEDVLIIRDKEIFENEGELNRFKTTLKTWLGSYYNKKSTFESRLLELNRLDTLNNQQKQEKFSIELYLSELDMDNAPQLNLLTSGYEEQLNSILHLAQELSSSIKQ